MLFTNTAAYLCLLTEKKEADAVKRRAELAIAKTIARAEGIDPSTLFYAAYTTRTQHAHTRALTVSHSTQTCTQSNAININEVVFCVFIISPSLPRFFCIKTTLPVTILPQRR